MEKHILNNDLYRDGYDLAVRKLNIVYRDGKVVYDKLLIFGEKVESSEYCDIADGKDVYIRKYTSGEAGDMVLVGEDIWIDNVDNVKVYIGGLCDGIIEVSRDKSVYCVMFDYGKRLILMEDILRFISGGSVWDSELRITSFSYENSYSCFSVLEKEMLDNISNFVIDKKGILYIDGKNEQGLLISSYDSGGSLKVSDYYGMENLVFKDLEIVRRSGEVAYMIEEDDEFVTRSVEFNVAGYKFELNMCSIDMLFDVCKR